MKRLDQYCRLQDFCHDLDHTGTPFPLKVMGKRNSNSFFSATMLSAVYEDTPDPDTTRSASVPTFFGQINSAGAAIAPSAAFSTIVPASDNSNLFQGDVIKLDLNQFRASGLFPRHAYSMILTQTCDASRSPFVVVAPVYRESELTGQTMNELNGAAFKNPIGARVNWLQNQKQPFVAFPPFTFDPHAAPDTDEPFLVALSLTMAMAGDFVRQQRVQLRLKYRALAFLQWRMATHSLRDVQHSDDSREY